MKSCDVWTLSLLRNISPPSSAGEKKGRPYLLGQVDDRNDSLRNSFMVSVRNFCFDLDLYQCVWLHL